jgi:N-acetylmuramoyl-L-alanine amidase
LASILGGRGASAVMGFLMLALASSEAPAQSIPAFDLKAAVRALDVDAAAKPLGTAAIRAAAAVAPAFTNVSTAVTTTASVAAKAISPTITSLYATPAARSVTVALPANATAAPAIAREAAWLYRAGWPLYALVDRYSAGAPLDAEANCVATAVYFESRGEALEGQLAVAHVVMNRAASGRYPSSWCSVVKQPAQFSFVRGGHFPAIDPGCAAWRKAQAITRLAVSNAVPSLSQDVLWYHADYVAPSWGRRLSFVQKIGTHIFYRA